MKKVLIIEDNYSNLRLLELALQRKRYNVIIAKDGKEGVENALKLKPFFIIMDINLPMKNGIETTKKIRNSEEGKNIPIIVITLNAIAGDRAMAMNAGCNGYFEKPIDPITIMDDIHKILGINQ